MMHNKVDVDMLTSTYLSFAKLQGRQLQPSRCRFRPIDGQYVSVVPRQRPPHSTPAGIEKNKTEKKHDNQKQATGSKSNDKIDPSVFPQSRPPIK